MGRSLARFVAVVSVVATLVVSVSVCASAERASSPPAPRPGSLEAYLALVARYRWSLSSDAEVNGTLEEMLSWRDKRMASSVGKFIRRLKGAEDVRADLCAVWMNAQADAMIVTGHVSVPLRTCDLAAPLRSAIALHALTANLALGRINTQRGLQELLFAHFLIQELPASESDFAIRARLTCGYLAQSYELLGVALSFLQELQGEASAGLEIPVALGAAYESYALTCAPGVGQTVATDACQRLRPEGGLDSGKGKAPRDALLRLAEANLRRALAVDPKVPAAHLRLGHVLAELGQAEAAVELRNVLAQSTDDGERALAGLFLTRLEERAGRQQEAIEYARSSVAAAPRSQTARAALARALLMSGAREEAAQEALDALTLEPQPVDYYLLYRLGVPWLLGPSFDRLRAAVW